MGLPDTRSTFPRIKKSAFKCRFGKAYLPFFFLPSASAVFAVGFFLGRDFP